MDSRRALKQEARIGQENRPMKSFVSRSAIIAALLLVSLIVFSAETSIAETLLFPFQSQNQESKQNLADPSGKAETQSAIEAARTETKALEPATAYVATAYSLRGRTASGRMVSRGLIAADPSILPLGSRVRLDHPGYSGEYLVADTGGAIRGRHIDIWTPSSSEAMRFGKRKVKLTVLSYGARRSKHKIRG
jgi:3D (Asp-Asp-Asp) domain-containing protein